MRIAVRNSGSIGFMPTRWGMGSNKTQANSSACSSSNSRARSVLLKGRMMTSLRGGGGAVGDGDTIGSIRIAPDGGVGDLTDFGVVVAAVVRPFDFGNLGASGERSRSLMVTITASVPEFMNRTFSKLGLREHKCSA